MISIIVAMDRNRLIGSNNGLPWRLPADLKHFKAITLGKPVIMGRKTYESIGRPLPERHNIVVSRTPGFVAPGCTTVTSADAALAAAGDVPEVMIIGGAQLYTQLLPQVQRIYLTQIDAAFDGDAWFPDLDTAVWHETAREGHLPDDRNPYAYSFLVLERR
ncbi:MAG: type 3 dihydrofolate reductase [Gammaproteobacteria bacterium]|nr:type 3 dihydrofolate reductase [Gammaproteobacteria bacterium]